MYPSLPPGVCGAPGRSRRAELDHLHLSFWMTRTQTICVIYSKVRLRPRHLGALMAEEFRLPVRALKGCTEPRRSQARVPAGVLCAPCVCTDARVGALLPKAGTSSFPAGLRGSEHPLPRPGEFSSWRRPQRLVSWCKAGAPQQPPDHVAGPDRSSSPLQLPLHSSTTLQSPGPCWICPPPYHGDVVAGMEENGEVGLLQAFLQRFQSLHHLISVIPGETWIQRERSVDTVPRFTPTCCRELGFTHELAQLSGRSQETKAAAKGQKSLPCKEPHCSAEQDPDKVLAL